MKSNTGNGTVEEYQGKPVSQWAKEIEGLTTANVDGVVVLPYEFSFDSYETLAEAKQSENWPSDNEILKIVNQSSERGAKASAYQKTIAKLKTAYEASPEFKRAGFIKSAVAMGFSLEEATALAASKIQ